MFSIFWLDFWGVVTLLSCMVGIYLGLFRLARFHTDDSLMARRLAWVVTTEILIYGITAFFCLATIYGFDMDGVFYPARALFFIANVYFSYNLVRPF